ncbi:glycoside hydrolase, partial [Mycena capillaripes]
GKAKVIEYLIKYARLSNTDDPMYVDTWKDSQYSLLVTFLATSTVGNHTYLADLDDDGKIRHVSSHLACFHAGNWLYVEGGTLAKSNDRQLRNDGCWSSLHLKFLETGIGPELFSFISDDGNFTGGDPPTAEQLDFYNEHRFYITFSLRPPSRRYNNFYAWRLTGDTRYLDRAAAAIDSFNKYLATSIGAFVGLNDVNSDNGGFWDVMESFWFAEVLKYLYLTFDDPNHISLDENIFNTECQPFKIPPPLNSYKGSGTLLPSKPFTVLCRRPRFLVSLVFIDFGIRCNPGQRAFGYFCCLLPGVFHAF